MISEVLKDLIQVAMVLIGCGMICAVYIAWGLKKVKIAINPPKNIDTYDIGTKVYFLSYGEIVSGKIESCEIKYAIKLDKEKSIFYRESNNIFTTPESLFNYMKNNIKE